MSDYLKSNMTSDEVINIVSTIKNGTMARLKYKTELPLKAEFAKLGYKMYKIYGIAYGKNREITYAKCLSTISDVIHIVPTFLRACDDYYLPVLSIDSIENNLIHIFVRKAKIKVKYRLSDFEFEIIKKEELENDM